MSGRSDEHDPLVRYLLDHCRRTPDGHLADDPRVVAAVVYRFIAEQDGDGDDEVLAGLSSCVSCMAEPAETGGDYCRDCHPEVSRG